MTGSTSHKLVTSDVSRILWLYYNDPVRSSHLARSTFLTTHPYQTTLFLICAGNELFFVALYLAHWVTTPISLSITTSIPLLEGLTWPELIALVCFPISALKNIVNVVQLWKASKILVGVDLAERAKARGGTKGVKA